MSPFGACSASLLGFLSETSGIGWYSHVASTVPLYARVPLQDLRAQNPACRADYARRRAVLYTALGGLRMLALWSSKIVSDGFAQFRTFLHPSMEG